MQDPTPDTNQTVERVVTTRQAPQTQYVTAAPVRQADNSKLLGLLIFLMLATTAGIVFYTMGKNKSDWNSLGRGNPSANPYALSSGVINSTSAEAVANRISSDADELSRLLSQFSSTIASNNAQLAQKQGELDNMNTLNGSLSQQLAELQRQLQSSQINGAMKGQLETQLADARRLLASANDEVARLNALLQNAPDSAEYQSLLAQLDRLRAELNSSPSQAELVRLQEENRRLKQELVAIKSQTNRSRLFAEDANMLSEKGQGLFRRLVTLEGSSNAERINVYSRIQEELNARVVESVNFSSGSSTVGVEKSAVIQKSLMATSPNAEYLIVGYASKSGDKGVNRELSAKRATSVATLTDIQRGATQTVKAVFLGQTDRFSGSNDFANQICEIWEILPE